MNEDLKRALELLGEAEINGRRYCDQMGIEQKTALVPCWVIRQILELIEQQRETTK